MTSDTDPLPALGEAGTGSSGPDVFTLASGVSQAIAASPDLDAMLSVIARRVAEALDVWECDIYEYRSETDELTATAIWSPDLTQRDREWLGGSYPLTARPSYRRLPWRPRRRPRRRACAAR